MKQNLRKVALAASTFAFAALFSFGWSDQSGVSLSIEKVEARVGRPLTPMSVAGVARRQYRRAAIGTAAAIGATAPYYTGGPWYGYSGWDDYAARNSIKCKPGGTVKLDDGQMYVCQ